MKSISKRLMAIAAAYTCILAAYADDTDLTCRRSERAMHYGEWAQAAALTGLALDARPDSAALYARAIVADDMLGDTTRCDALLESAMAHGVALDSVVDAVRRDAFAIGQARIYDRFLTRTRRRMPWLSRAIDARLLDYYAMRGDGDRTVELATAMLRGLPDSTRYLTLLARGYDMQGDPEAADNTRRRILDIDPDNLEALRALGCSLARQGHGDEARTILVRAQDLSPTPYIDKILHE